MSLARTILVFEWRRFLPAVLSVAFAGVLMLVQLGLLKGMFGTVTVLVDSTAADLWITAPATESVDQATSIPASLSTLLLASPEIVRSSTLSLTDGEWRSPGSAKVAVTLVGLPPDPSSLACPEPLRDQICGLLAIPDTVVVDRSEAEKLGTASGDTAEINGHRVRVTALSEGMRSIGSTYVFLSQQTLRGLGITDPQDGPALTSFVLAQVTAGSDPRKTRTRLQQLLQPKLAKVWTRHQLSQHSQGWWLRESGVGAGFLFSTLLGIVIALVITSQSLRSVILSQMREYAAFRAIGIPARRLGLVVIEQSAWVGLVGSVLMGLLVLMVTVLARELYVPFTLGIGGIVAAILVGLVTAMGSGLFALRELYRLEPAVLLR